jgi:1-acyl-sn-glycerol-3-phosphate acyltransferase
MKFINPMTKTLGVFYETFQRLQETKFADRPVQDIKLDWARNILKTLNVELEILGKVSSRESLLFVGNHISYLDIVILLASAPDLSFVAKSEIANWPLFGAAAKRIDTVFVKRENGSSRAAARSSIYEAFNEGKRIVIFPSGTTSTNESKTWKKGAFEIAADRDTFIQPFRIRYRPRRSAAYIDRDFFPWHLYQLARLQKVAATIEFHDPVKAKDPVHDALYWQNWTRGRVLNDHSEMPLEVVSKNTL